MRFHSRAVLHALLLAVLILMSGCASGAATVAKRDILWSILNTCVDRDAPDYCSKCMSPRVGTPCAAGKTCKETTEVWAESADVVVLRDRKMCDCPEEFVHGLALPRSKVTGVEDPNRPDGIWKFAWALANYRIGKESEVALAVNPPAYRDQDQLHVHLVRLQPDARQRFPGHPTATVGKLESVWQTASGLAASAGLKEYGVLVVRHPQGGFQVVLDEGSPEKDFTVARCH